MYGIINRTIIFRATVLELELKQKFRLEHYIIFYYLVSIYHSIVITDELYACISLVNF